METKLALKLATLAANFVEAKRPIDVKVTEAKLDGAAEVANVMGYALTPFGVAIAAIEWVRDNPRPNDVSAMQLQSKAWREAVESDFTAKLYALQTA